MAHKFLLAGLSGAMAITIIHPLDLIKARLQMSGVAGNEEYKGIFHCVKTVIKNEGCLALYRGLSANVVRQLAYTTVRLGLFTVLANLHKDEIGALTIFSRFIIGLIAGGVGAFLGTPADVALIRMTTDGAAPPDQRRGYKNVCDALNRMRKEEGILTWWRGWKATVVRACVANSFSLGSYSQVKHELITKCDLPDDVLVHFLASMVSGVVTTFVSMPMDICKTRLQNMKSVDGKPEYTGICDVLIKVIKNEGFFAMWKGAIPFYARVAPKNVLTFIFFEQFSKLWDFVTTGQRKESGL